MLDEKLNLDTSRLLGFRLLGNLSPAAKPEIHVIGARVGQEPGKVIPIPPED